MTGPSPLQARILAIWAWVLPRPEADVELNPPAIFQTYERALGEIRKTQNTDMIDALADMSKELFEDARDTRGHVETRASATVTATGIGLAALAGIASLWSQQSQKVAWVPAITLGAIVIALLYLISSIMIAQRVYGANVRSTLGPPDIVPGTGANKYAYSLRVSGLRVEYAIHNYKANNRALGFVLAAQRRLVRGVTLLAIAGGVVLIFQAPKSTGTTPVAITAQTVQLIAASQTAASTAASASAASVGVAASSAPASPVDVLPPAQPGQPAAASSSQPNVASVPGNASTVNGTASTAHASHGAKHKHP
ncbi:hypothetical protein [Paraburkholderia sp. DHOC27]|uniref:hypothetical protein n=1 Tax=Paraburkholderia sp. DHOC27 TaxID=2303330 RepID=UPI000E3BBB57|nr:hypothetical protein [Paraburkholderia sp. DHOC27]RFU49586.1 hypothetical protein D0B32_07320 [Paraburkholderia sp. DHOC27]